MRLRLLIAGLLAYAALALAWGGRAPAPAAGFDLARAVRGAEVTIVERGKRSGCRKDGAGFRCGPDAWAWVGPYAGRSGGRGQRCLWVHPLRHAATTEVRLPEVPLGAEVDLRASLLEGSGKGPTVFVKLSTGGRSIGRVSVSDEWEAGTLHAAVPPGPERGPLLLEVHANKNDWRKLCVTLAMHGRRRAGPRRPTRAKPGRAGDRVRGSVR